MKWLILAVLIVALSAQLADFVPVRDWIEAKTGKTPGEWGYEAGVATRRIFVKDDV